MKSLRKAFFPAFIVMLLSFLGTSCSKLNSPSLGEKTRISEGLKIQSSALRALNAYPSDTFGLYLKTLDLKSIPIGDRFRDIEIRQIHRSSQDGFETCLATMFSHNQFIGQLIYVNRIKDNVSGAIFADWSRVNNGNGYILNYYIGEGYISTLKIRKQGSQLYYKISDVAPDKPESNIVLTKKESLKQCVVRVFTYAKKACDADLECRVECAIADRLGLCTAATATAALISCMKNRKQTTATKASAL